MSKIIFGAVLYKQAQPYLFDFINSIKTQSYQDFELLILNDNYEVGELEGLLEELLDDEAVPVTATESVEVGGTGGNPNSRLTLVETGGKFSPAMLRVELLLEAKKLNGDLIIIGDADDTFAHDRVEKLVKAYELNPNAAFYYNDLLTEDGKPIFNTLPATCGGPDDRHFLVNSNFLGMSTTAINLGKLSSEWIETLREGDTHIFDWYLFERLSLDIGYGTYVQETGTIYRQHAGNLAGDQTTDFSLDYLQKEKTVKIEHYRLMAKRYPEYERYVEAMEKVDLCKILPMRGGYWWSKIRLDLEEIGNSENEGK